jgi:hypothetical protein
MPPIPHIAAPNEPTMPVPAARPIRPPIWKNKIVVIGVAASFVLLAGAGWFFFLRPAPPLPPPSKPAKPATAAVPAPKPAAPAADLANKPAAATPASAAGPALSETQAAIAHAPVNAINKAKDVAAKRVGGDQGREAVNAIMDGDASAGKAAAKAPAPQVSTSTSIAPGISATNADVGAGAEASPAFRSLVANAKVSGVFQGNPPRIMLNGRLVRGGEIIDGGLNVTFDSIDAEKKMLIFKDKSGATVTRRY